MSFEGDDGTLSYMNLALFLPHRPLGVVFSEHWTCLRVVLPCVETGFVLVVCS